MRIRCSTLADVGLGESFDAITLVAVLHHLPLEAAGPTAAPAETWEEVKCAVQAELPGCRVRRRLFWRYSVVFAESRLASIPFT